MAPVLAPNPVVEPFAISSIGGRYLIFDVDVIAHCRRAHNICGVLIGTIPNLSQQNVFLGVPMELMPEEARILVERGAAHVIDDAAAHREGFMEMSRADRLKYLEEMDHKGTEVAKEFQDMAERRKDKALKDKGLRKTVLEIQSEGSIAESTATDETLRIEESGTASPGLGFIMKGSTFSDSSTEDQRSTVSSATDASTLFDPTPVELSPSATTSKVNGLTVQRHYVTPTTSYPPFPTLSPEGVSDLPVVPNSYPLFRYLHSKGYFHMPGIRFGCHYNVYPGDPLRYHSHFAATGLAWDEEFELLDVVGGGRLGTGTKKAYMIGGEDPKATGHGEGLSSERSADMQYIRAFSIEWAAI